MKKMRLVLSLFLLSISLFACQQNSEVIVDNPQVNTEIERITIKRFDNKSKALVIEDTETIEMIKEAIDNSEKQPGLVNMSDPEFRMIIGEEIYFLWVDEKSGTIMNLKDSHTIYSLSDNSIKQINGLLN